MSMRVRLVVSDIDGTLVRHDKSLSDPVIAAVRRLTGAGVPFSLISARPSSGMLWIAERLGLEAPIGAFNGGTIARPDGTILSADRLAPKAAARALALIDRPGVEPWLFADGLWYARTTGNPRVAREKLSVNVPPTLVADFAALLARVDKLVGVSEDHALLERLEGEVQAALEDGATVARSQPYFLDVTSPRGNKGDGVAALAEALGISLAETLVIGDQRNDLPMFARAGFAIAMGEGPDEVKQAAAAVTSSNEEDGVAHAIDTIILPMVAK